MMGTVSISPVAVTTEYAASALCGPFMIKLLMPGATTPDIGTLYPCVYIHLTCRHSPNEAHILSFFTLSAHTPPKYGDSV